MAEDEDLSAWVISATFVFMWILLCIIAWCNPEETLVATRGGSGVTRGNLVLEGAGGGTCPPSSDESDDEDEDEGNEDEFFFHV